MSNDERLTWSLTDSFNEDFSNYSKLNERNTGRENQAFIYPGPYARNISGTKTGFNAKMRRGFMRSIIMDNSIASAFKTKSPGNLRLNFQFNPEYIERRVSQSPGAVNPLLQNPANLTQAVPGTAQFNFTMTFNREAEVALSTGRLNFDSTIEDENGIQNQLKDPGKVGVMHDLAIFDQIIGQGITKDLVDVITAYTRQQTIANNNAATANPKDDDEEGTEVTAFNETSFTSSLNANFGNSAFLNPMPVRVVFSDLFMVEGLIVGSAVAFQKFNQNMIPTVCQVNCELYALYVGFAKKKAFLTNNLGDWAKTTASDAAKNAANTNAAKNNMAKRVKRVYVVVNSSDPSALTKQDKENLETPDFNSDAMKILAPTTTNLYYQGNVDGDNRWVTLPQWYNAFATPTPLAYQQDYTYDQEDNDSTKVGKLPISIWIEYAPIAGQKLEDVDADFNITVNIKDLSTNTIKNVGVEPGEDWKITRTSGGWGFVIPGQDAKRKDNKLIHRVFWIDPLNVVKKSGISSTAECSLNITLTMSQNVEGAGRVSLNFKPFERRYPTGAPLYKKGNDQHKAIAIKPFTPKPILPVGGAPRAI